MTRLISIKLKHDFYFCKMFFVQNKFLRQKLYLQSHFGKEKIEQPIVGQDTSLI